MHDLAIHPTNDGSAEAPDAESIPSAGRAARGWIQAPIARVQFASIAARPFVQSGPYALTDAASRDGGEQNELAAFQLASAASFWAFEDSLPEE